MFAQLPSLSELLKGPRLWVVVAVALTIIVLGYYVVLGGRFFGARGQIVFLTSRIGQLTAETSRPLPNESALLETMDGLIAEREAELPKFEYRETDELLSIISDTALVTRVDVTVVSMGDIEPEVIRGVIYQVQPAGITVKGETLRIYQFLDALRATLPVTEVQELRLSIADTGDAQAQVNLLFYMDPTFKSAEAGG